MRIHGTCSSSEISDIDISGLIYLIGDLVNPADSLEVRRRTLVGGLAEWIGAEGWGWLRWDGARMHGWQCGMAATAWARLQDSARLPQPADRQVGSVLSRFLGRVPRTGVVLFRSSKRPAFSARESRLATILLEEVDWLYRDAPPPTPRGSAPRLSPRQEEVSALLLQGMSRKQISGELSIPENTLASHIREIYRKYQVRSHAAFLLARRSELYPASEA